MEPTEGCCPGTGGAAFCHQNPSPRIISPPLLRYPGLPSVCATARCQAYDGTVPQKDSG